MRPIDADKLKKHIKAECNPYGKPTIGFEDGCKVMEMIDNEPTVESEPVRHGRWELTDNFNFKRCSECGKKRYRILADYTPYCANCGARMDGGDDDG